MKPREYTDELRFRIVNPGTPDEHLGLVPSEMDLALLSLQTASLERELEALDKDEAINGVAALRTRLEAGEELAAYNRAKVTDGDGRRCAFRQALRQTQERQERSRQWMDQAPTSGLVVRQFRLREFSWGERMDAEDEHSVLDPTTGERRVDLRRRNAALLKRCLLGEFGDDGLEPIKDPELSLGPRIFETLVERTWARAELSPELIDHFRQRG